MIPTNEAAPLPEDVLRSLAFEQVEDAVFATDLANRVIFWAPSAERMFGYTAAQALGRQYGDLLPFRIEGADERDLLTTVAAGQTFRAEGSVQLRDGRELWLESSVRPIVDQGRIVGAVSVSRDRTARRTAEQAQEVTGRALRTISAVNRALVRAPDEETLLNETCRIIVEAGGYRFAWVGFAEDDPEHTIRPVAQSALGADYLHSIRVTWGDDPRGQGPGGVSVRTGRPDVLRDVRDPRFRPWLKEAGPRGFTSSAALPLRDKDHTFGMLGVYSADPEAFTDAEVTLLVELADDLAFGILACRTRVAHEQAVERIRTSEERYRTALNALAEGILVRGADGEIVALNPAARAILGPRVISRLARPGVDLGLLREDGSPFPPDEYPLLTTLRSGRARRNVIMGFPRRDHVRWVAFHTEPIRLEDGRSAALASFEDVTHYRLAKAERLFDVELRTALLEATHAIPAGAKLEESAQAVCDRLGSLPGIDFTALAAFLDRQSLRTLAIHFPRATRTTEWPTLPSDEVTDIYDQALAGPWATRSSAGVPRVRSLRGWLAALGVRAFAAGPITRGGVLEGILVTGTRDPDFARVLIERMPAIAAFSATASGLLADQLRTSREERELARMVEAIIEGSAFHPVFQPIVDLETREIVGYEALTRFTDDARPERRFQEAWRIGLGSELEFATLQLALAHAGRLPAGRWVDLNVSPRLLLDHGKLRELLHVANRPVVLEVTEHEHVADYTALRDAVRSIGRDLRLAVDDAGAGEANFAHIVELRPDFVKLDIRLVRNVNADLGRQALVAAMRQFARNTGCRLVAEGVETEEEAATLAAAGVELGQGYLFGRPAPVEAWAT